MNDVLLATQLGLLAMQFRGAKDDGERDRVAKNYATAVRKLIASGEWKEMPTFEDMLPDERMPAEFFTHWKPLRTGTPKKGR